MELPLPTAESGEQATDDERPRVTINVLSDGQLILGGQVVQPHELVARLRDRVGKSNEDLQVRIRGDRTAPYGNVEPIMLACARAGIWNVTYAVYRKEQVP